MHIEMDTSYDEEIRRLQPHDTYPGVGRASVNYEGEGLRAEGDHSDICDVLVDGRSARRVRREGFGLVVVHGIASKVALQNVLGSDRLARGSFVNRDHNTFLMLSGHGRDEGGDRGNESEGRG
jgi:hypothetical protein